MAEDGGRGGRRRVLAKRRSRLRLAIGGIARLKDVSCGVRDAAGVEARASPGTVDLLTGTLTICIDMHYRGGLMDNDNVVSSAGANRHFSQIIRAVRDGMSFVVTSHGRPVARIIPLRTRRALEARRERVSWTGCGWRTPCCPRKQRFDRRARRGRISSQHLDSTSASVTSRRCRPARRFEC